MKRTPNTTLSGFTLIEMVIAIVLLAIVSTGVIILYGGLFYRAGDIQSVQQGTLLVQACVDNINGLRKNQANFFTTPTSTLDLSCAYLPTLLNSSVTLVVTSSQPISAASPPCPASPVSCVRFDIYAQNGTWKSQNTTLFFINY